MERFIIDEEEIEMPEVSTSLRGKWDILGELPVGKSFIAAREYTDDDLRKIKQAVNHWRVSTKSFKGARDFVFIVAKTRLDEKGEHYGIRVWRKE